MNVHVLVHVRVLVCCGSGAGLNVSVCHYCRRAAAVLHAPLLPLGPQRLALQLPAAGCLLAACVAPACLVQAAAPAQLPTAMPCSLQVVECMNLDYRQREKQLGQPPTLRLWPTGAHLRTVSWWAAVLQVAGIVVSPPGAAAAAAGATWDGYLMCLMPACRRSLRAAHSCLAAVVPCLPHHTATTMP